MKQRETETSRTFTCKWKNSLKAVLGRLLLFSLLLSFSFCFKYLETSPVLKRRADGNSSFDPAFSERARCHPNCLTPLTIPPLQGTGSVASDHFLSRPISLSLPHLSPSSASCNFIFILTSKCLSHLPFSILLPPS